MNQNFEDQSMIYDAGGAERESKIFVIDDVLFTYFAGENVINKFKGTKKQEPWILPENLGKMVAI